MNVAASTWHFCSSKASQSQAGLPGMHTAVGLMGWLLASVLGRETGLRKLNKQCLEALSLSVMVNKCHQLQILQASGYRISSKEEYSTLLHLRD